MPDIKNLGLCRVYMTIDLPRVAMKYHGLTIFDIPEHHIFLLKGKVATARGYDDHVCQNCQPVLFHSHPGQTIDMDHV